MCFGAPPHSPILLTKNNINTIKEVCNYRKIRSCESMLVAYDSTNWQEINHRQVIQTSLLCRMMYVDGGAIIFIKPSHFKGIHGKIRITQRTMYTQGIL